MKVAFISMLPPDRHGVPIWGFQLLRALAELPQIERIDALGTTYDGAPEHETWFDKVHVHRCFTLGDSASLLRLVSRVRKLQPDVVHINCGIRTWGNGRVVSFAGALLPWLLRPICKRVIVSLHTIAETVDLSRFKDEIGPITRAGIDVAQRAYLSASAVTVTLESMQRALERRYGASNVHYIPHGCYEVNAPPLRTGGHRLMTIGYWGTYKDPSIVVDAVSTLRARGLPVELQVAGGVHPYYPQLYGELVAKFRHLEYVRFLGYVPDEAIDQLFADATAVVLPYQSNAGASGVLNMARAYGRPIVISKEPALVEQMTNEGGSYLAFDSEASLADQLERLLKDEALQREMADQNLAAARALSMQMIARRIAALY